MMFMCTLRILPGHYEQAIRNYKNPKVPSGVKLHNFLGTFGEVDAFVVFEAPDEGTAAEFVVQFREHSHTATSVVFSVSDYKWTR